MMVSFLTAYSGAKLPMPDYGNLCITQLPSFFHSVLTNNASNPLAKLASAQNMPLDKIKHVVFFLVDGFGYAQWEKYKTKVNILQQFEIQGFVGKIDSVFPSSTPVAMNALNGRGAVPASHGLIDWWLYIQQIDKIIATLPFAPMGSSVKDSLLSEGVEPSALFTGKTTYEQFEEGGISTRVFIKEDYAASVYTKTAHKGARIILHKDVASLFSTLSNELNAPQDRPTYDFVYWGGIDAVGHSQGLDSQQYEAAVLEYFDAMADFMDTAGEAKDTLFVISADHGQISIDPQKTIYLDGIAGLPELLRLSTNGQLILPWGGPREVFVAIKDGALEPALGLLQEAIGEQVELIGSKAALEAGLFGLTSQLHPDLSSRIGDIIVLPKGNATVWYHHPGQKPLNLNGHHGGLSDNELKVPFALLRKA